MDFFSKRYNIGDAIFSGERNSEGECNIERYEILDGMKYQRDKVYIEKKKENSG